MLYIAFEGDDSAIQWCQFCVSLSGSLFNILQLFASFSQNPMLLQQGSTLAVFRYPEHPRFSDGIPDSRAQ